MDMRLSGPLPTKPSSPEEWVNSVKSFGYSGAYAPLSPDVDDATVSAYALAARRANIVIGEVGAWCNPISPDPVQAASALDKCVATLDFAERIGARCCVNITGSRDSERWDAPHWENFSKETFDMIVETTRKIVDAVNPKRTFYTLETMPWIFPSSPDEYLDLLYAIDRPGVAVHLDPVNMINTPKMAFRSGEFIRECFAKLGSRIKSCHAKDIAIQKKLTVHLDECRPGTGLLDYPVFLRELSKLDPDTTLCLEHLSDAEYPLAAEYLRTVAKQEHLDFTGGNL